MEKHAPDADTFDPVLASDTLEGLSSALHDIAVNDLNNLTDPIDPETHSRLVSLADAVHQYAKSLAGYLDK